MRGRVAQLALVLLLPTSVDAWATPPAASQRAVFGLDLVPANTRSLVPQAASVPRADRPQPTGPAVGALLGSAAALVALVGLQSRGRRHSRRRFALVTRRAEDADLEEELKSFPRYAGLDGIPAGQDDRVVQAREYRDGSKNFINPWEQRLRLTPEQQADEKIPVGHKFRRYYGPVYKGVPVSEELTFPLDPKVYYEPLEPPPPGRKWGDGRAPDGLFYMDIDGEKVQYWQSWGRRKTACAIVKIVKGTGQFIINGVEAIVYLQNNTLHWIKACEPIAALSQKNNFDIICKAFGGGYSGQAGAIRLGLARAMQDYNFEWRPLLKKAKYLTRDWRMVEPKKAGQPKARKKTPYHKR